MQKILRRHLLALMIGATAMTFAMPILFDTSALASNGSDDGAGQDSDDDNGGSSGSSSSDDGSSDDSSSGSGSSDDDSDDDDSGSSDDNSPDDSDDDSSGGGSSSGNDSDDDDSDNDNNSSSSSKKSSKAEKQSGKNTSRPTATITLTAVSLASVRSGTHVVVDQLGRQLEIRVLNINGQQVIRAKPHGGDAKRNPGPIADIRVVPVTAVAGNDDGTADQGPGDN